MFWDFLTGNQPAKVTSTGIDEALAKASPEVVKASQDMLAGRAVTSDAQNLVFNYLVSMGCDINLWRERLLQVKPITENQIDTAAPSGFSEYSDPRGTGGLAEFGRAVGGVLFGDNFVQKYADDNYNDPNKSPDFPWRGLVLAVLGIGAVIGGIKVYTLTKKKSKKR